MTNATLGILGSTRGSLLAPLLDASNTGQLHGQIGVVISNNASAGILTQAGKHNVPHYYLSPEAKSRQQYDQEIDRVLRLHQVDMVVLIGYMRIISDWLCQRWFGRMLNTHPSLLPRHSGLMDLAVHKSVLAAGDSETGCSVHLVTPQIDQGTVLGQKSCPVYHDDSPETIKARVQQLEAQTLIEVINNQLKVELKKEFYV